MEPRNESWKKDSKFDEKSFGLSGEIEACMGTVHARVNHGSGEKAKIPSQTKIHIH